MTFHDFDAQTHSLFLSKVRELAAEKGWTTDQALAAYQAALDADPRNHGFVDVNAPGNYLYTGGLEEVMIAAAK